MRESPKNLIWHRTKTLLLSVKHLGQYLLGVRLQEDNLQNKIQVVFVREMCHVSLVLSQSAVTKVFWVIFVCVCSPRPSL